GESADTAEHFGTVGATNSRLHQLDGEIARRGVDAGFGIGVRWRRGHTPSLPAARAPAVPCPLPRMGGMNAAAGPEWVVREDAGMPVLVALYLRQALGLRYPDELPL